jgi:hypothetical protein
MFINSFCCTLIAHVNTEAKFSPEILDLHLDLIKFTGEREGLPK